MYKMSKAAIMSSHNATILAVQQAVDAWGVVDYSNNAISWRASPPIGVKGTDSNFQRVYQGIFEETLRAENCTFFGRKNR